MKRVLILGSTGSIGTQALEIIRLYRDEFKVVGLAAGSNVDLLSKQIGEFNPQYVSVENRPFTSDKVIVLKDAMELIQSVEADIILLAMVGISGLKVANYAVSTGARIALANKETLVAAGDIIMSRAMEFNSEIIPVDSEHSAIWQCLMGNNHQHIGRIILTASGGAFRDLTKQQLLTSKAVDALKHPVWNMGLKVTIDSATLMNKGLEVIEAKHLFNISSKQIDVVVHPESIIHSMVEYNDGSVIAQLSNPDMRLPIQLAFTYPARISSPVKRLDFSRLSRLNFMQADTERFPCLEIAYQCLEYGGIACAIMNAANEIAVNLYLEDRISFYDIPALIKRALDKYNNCVIGTIDDIICIDSNVKEYILTLAK